MRVCTNLAFQKSNDQLEKEVLAILEFLEEKDDRKHGPFFINGQNAWLKYRNEHCNLYYQQYRGGTLAPIIYMDCLKRQTDKRLEELEAVKELIFFE